MYKQICCSDKTTRTVANNHRHDLPSLRTRRRNSFHSFLLSTFRYPRIILTTCCKVMKWIHIDVSRQFKLNEIFWIVLTASFCLLILECHRIARVISFQVSIKMSGLSTSSINVMCAKNGHLLHTFQYTYVWLTRLLIYYDCMRLMIWTYRFRTE